MAKRKRLSPAQTGYLANEGQGSRASLSPATGLSGAGEPPIAQVARDAATTAALEEVSAELSSARAEGRLVQALPLDTIVRDYLVRDRVVLEDEDMSALKASLRARGQQTPIEVVDLGQGGYGLISGWRRLSALDALHRETGDERFATVQALLRRPETAGDAYTAMVEENEIRVGLSPFERARIVAKAVEQGVFADERTALRALFASASRAKRSKIGSFLRLVAAFEQDLRFPGGIAERLGLRMAKALEETPGFEDRLKSALRATPAATVDAELALIEAALRSAPTQPTSPAVAPNGTTDRLEVTRKGKRLVLSGQGVTAEFEIALRKWLRTQGL
ncbi:ParB/RepB/Spo0J family partition protein [Tropicimonas sp. S265A]|uniref:ParB/RepB/Spo0J family partition protein n=1 Tax=Tropicimonas sp. S265A TaxID=3415134 RepID=UPI003C7D34C5